MSHGTIVRRSEAGLEGFLDSCDAAYWGRRDQGEARMRYDHSARAGDKPLGCTQTHQRVARSTPRTWYIFAMLAASALAVLPNEVIATKLPYQLLTHYQLSAGADVFDVLGDGRIIALVNDNVYIETAVRSRQFSLHGTLPDAPPLAFPSFIRVSPDGSKMAVGDGSGQVGVFEVVALTGRWFNATHYDAEWFDNRHLALSGANPGSVRVLDTQSPDSMNPTSPIIIVNKGVPGGITFDTDGNLYTGNGSSDSGPIHTGDIKQFSRSSWMAAWTGGSPLDFVTDGTLVATVLSAASLGFDSQGNMHVGGGDFLGGGAEVDSVAIVRSTAILNALKGMGPADANDSTQVQRLDPDALDDFNFYSVTFNSMTQELYIQSFGLGTVYAYFDATVIPTVSEWGLAALSLLLTISGSILLRKQELRPLFAGKEA